MSNINLLLEIYFDETDIEGLAAMQGLVSRAHDVQLEVFADGHKLKSEDDNAVLLIGKPFNFAACSLTVGDDLLNTSRIDVRYRPAIRSKMWARLDLPSDPALLMKRAAQVRS